MFLFPTWFFCFIFFSFFQGTLKQNTNNEEFYFSQEIKSFLPNDTKQQLFFPENKVLSFIKKKTFIIYCILFFKSWLYHLAKLESGLSSKK